MLIASDYQTRAQQHRPNEPNLIDSEIRRLYRAGLSSRDIAAALRVAPDVALNAIHAPPEKENQK